MKRPRHPVLLAVALAALLTSCVSVTSVTKVRPGENPSGYRYALPQPYILALPKGDGTVTYTEMSLPDLSQQYAINTFTIGAKNTLAIEADKLLLKKMTTTKDTTALAKQVLTSGGNIAKTEMEQQAKVHDSQTAARTKAQEAIASKDLALKLAQAERDALPGDAKADAIAAADLKVNKAKIELESVRQQYSKIIGANLVGTDQKVPGPVLFKVVDRGDYGVELVAVRINGQFQPSFPTSTKKKSPNPIPTARASVSPTTMSLHKLSGTMEVDFTVDPDGTLFEISSIKVGTPGATITGYIVNSVGLHQYRLTINPPLSVGTYAIRYNLTPPGSKTPIIQEAKVVLTE